MQPHIRTYVIVTSFLLFFQFGYSQTPFTCGSDSIVKHKMAKDSVYRNFVIRIKTQIADKINQKQFDGTNYVIPVVFVVYNLGEAVGTGSNVSDVALQAQVDLMNQMFAGSSSTYPGATSNIRFTLAKRTSDCQSFNGIVRIDGRAVTNYQATGVDVYDYTIQDQLRQLSGAYTSRQATNFVVIRVAHTLSGAAGWATFGGDIFVEASSMNSLASFNNVLTHEMGHVLFLKHTFDGYGVNASGDATCPPNNNPSIDGDAVADTDPHKPFEPSGLTLSFVSSLNSCTGQPFGWIGNNFMSYGYYTNRFTPGQVDYMRAFLTTENRELGLSNFGSVPPTSEVMTPATCTVSTINKPPAGYLTGVSRFRFNTIDRTSDNFPFYSGYYQNYSCTDRTTVAVGGTYSFSISAPVLSTGNYRKIYIDYNNNGTFEPNELVFSVVGNFNLTTGSIIIPANATPNVYLRMRVVVDNGSISPTACQLTGSAAYGYGEIEDYGILIQSINCQLPTATLSGSTTITSGQTATLTAILTGQSPWSVGLNTGQVYNGINTSPFIFTVSPTTTTSYFLSNISNSCGTGTVNGTALIAVQTSATCTDPYEPNNTASTATDLLSTTSVVTVPLCLNQQGDLDWFRWNYGGKTYYILVRGINTNATGSYRLSLNVQSNTLTVATSSVTNSTTDTFLTLFNNDATTVLATNNDFGGSIFSRIIYPLSTSGTAITCVTATNLYEDSITPTVAGVFWTNPSGNGWTNILRFRPQGTTNWTIRDYLSNNTVGITIGPLTSGVVYEWQILTSCNEGSQESVTRSFTAQCSTPVYRHTEGISPTGATVYWSNYTAHDYVIRWKVVNTNAWTESPVITISPYGDNTKYSIGGLATGQTYEWQVKMVCSGISTAYSPSLSFTTGCNTPWFADFFSHKTSDNAATVYFSPAGLGTIYEIEYRPKNSVSSPLSLTTALYELLITGLQPNTEYEFRVRMVCGAGQYSAFSSYSIFRTQVACSTNMYTVTNGFWSSPSTWSCNRTPIANDTVEIRHSVYVSTNQLQYGQRIKYTNGGKLILYPGGKLKLGQ